MSGKRNSILDQYRRPQQKAVPSPEQSSESARALPPGQMMLDLWFANGNHHAFAYIDLRSMKFNPSEGIVLEFATRTVTITGRRLKLVYELLSRHQVRFLREQGESFEAPGSDKPFIERIVVADRDDHSPRGKT